MPRKISTNWSSMDFGSEDEDVQPPARVYVDPWDLENYAFMRRRLDEGDPGASDEWRVGVLSSLQRTIPSADSPTLFAGIDELDFHNDNFEVPYERFYHHDQKCVSSRPTFTDTGSSLSSSNENCVYMTDGCDPTSPDASLVYIYETTSRKRKMALPKSSRRTSQCAPLVRKFRRVRDLDDCIECRTMKESGYLDAYDLDFHTVPGVQINPPPDNFSLSSYGHLKIDYSCSWHSLDKLIKSSER